MKRIFWILMASILLAAMLFFAIALLPGCTSAPPGTAAPKITPVQRPKVIYVTNEVIRYRTNVIILYTNIPMPKLNYSKL